MEIKVIFYIKKVMHLVTTNMIVLLVGVPTIF